MNNQIDFLWRPFLFVYPRHFRFPLSAKNKKEIETAAAEEGNCEIEKIWKSEIFHAWQFSRVLFLSLFQQREHKILSLMALRGELCEALKTQENVVMWQQQRKSEYKSNGWADWEDVYAFHSQLSSIRSAQPSMFLLLYGIQWTPSQHIRPIPSLKNLTKRSSSQSNFHPANEHSKSSLSLSYRRRSENRNLCKKLLKNVFKDDNMDGSLLIYIFFAIQNFQHCLNFTSAAADVAW